MEQQKNNLKKQTTVHTDTILLSLENPYDSLQYEEARSFNLDVYHPLNKNDTGTLYINAISVVRNTSIINVNILSVNLNKNHAYIQSVANLCYNVNILSVNLNKNHAYIQSVANLCYNVNIRYVNRIK